MAKIQKLELTWAGKNARIHPEPRILMEDKSRAYGDPDSTNMLIHGDNLLALKSLEADFAGQVKCIYIDPPYNTGSAFEHYDDGLEHSTWLSLMRERIEILWSLLSDDGLLAIQIDDNEFARLYLLLIEICGEHNLKTICVKMSEATGVKMASVNKAGSIPKLKEFIILAKKDGIRNLHLEKIAKDKWDKEYKTYCENISDTELEFIKSMLEQDDVSDSDIAKIDSIIGKIIFRNANDVAKEQTGENATEEWLFANSVRIVQFATLTGGARDIAIQKKKLYENSVPAAFTIKTKQNKLYFIRGDFNTETNLSRCKLLFADQYLETNPGDLWTDIKTTGLDNEGCNDFKNGKKPEKLIARILKMNTNPGDLVLDSFLGSGTTAAVAHKMGRRWIGIELGDHAYTHCQVRMQKVVDGTDAGGISKAVGWTGGGGFKFYELASSLLVEDDMGNLIIDKKYNPDMLAEAMCKLMGYKYAPDKNTFWKQGKGTENNYIFTTTLVMTAQYLEEIGRTLGNDSLMICCSAFIGDASAYPNITIKRIPKAVLDKCEWNKPGYPLPVRDDFVDEDFEFGD